MRTSDALDTPSRVAHDAIGVAPRSVIASYDASLTAIALIVAVASQCLRAMFPVVYVYREESGLTPTIAVLLAVFVAPAAAPLLARAVRAQTALIAAAVALAASRMALQATSNVTVALSAVAAAAALFAVTMAVVVFRHRGPMVAVAIVGGLALDTVIRAAWSTWDVVWQRGALPWAVTVALVVAVVLSAVWARSGARESRGGMAVVGVVLGSYLTLQVWFLQSPAFVASSGALALATAAAVVLVGDALAVLAIAWSAQSARVRGVMSGAAVVGVAAGVLLPRSTDAAAVAVVLAGQVAASMLLASTLTGRVRAHRGATRRDVLGILAGSLLFGAVVLLYQLQYDRPLPFSNRLLPVAAFAVLAVVGVATGVRSGVQPRRSKAATAIAGAIAAITVVVFVGVALGEPDLGPAVASLHSLRIVTYNPHETVTRAGQLDPDAFAATVENLRPDVLVVEEAGRGWLLSAGLDLAEWTKRRLGLPYVWAPAADHQFGNLLFSRVPILGARVVRLPQGAGTMKRSAIVARVGPIDGDVVRIVGAHFQNGSRPAHHETRLREIRALRNALGPGPLRRTVVAGDLNSDPGSRELHALLDLGFVTRQPTEHCTLRTTNQHCSDWILVTPDLEQRSVRVLAFDAFDHRPVLSVIAPGTGR